MSHTTELADRVIHYNGNYHSSFVYSSSCFLLFAFIYLDFTKLRA